MDSKKKLFLIVAGALVLAALVFFIMTMTAGDPKGLQPSPDKAPSGN